MSNAVRIDKRKPTTEERQAASRLAREIRQVTYPDRQKTRVRSELPPGRISPRRHMLKQQQRAMHQPVTAKPYNAVKRARTEHTEIKVGIAADISGSMSNAMLPLAVTRWVLAEAVHQANGRVASVLFGTDAHPIQAPHERVSTIEVYQADGRHESFDEAFPLLDSVLDLIDGDGARLLVVITDGHFVKSGVPQYTEKVMDMCRAAGVAVLWLDTSGYFARPDGYGHGEVISVSDMTAIQMANTVGQRVVRAFREQASQHRLLVA